MKEVTKTFCFVGTAAAMLVAAVVSNIANQPRVGSDFETVGRPFYEEFTDTTAARSLVVNAFDTSTVKRQKFEIKQIDGLWQIPSHEGYPAEAAQKLAKTSASLIGLTRDSLVGRRESDHEKFGVVDPRDPDIIDVGAVGQSITLRDANDDVLADLIIGKVADSASERTTPGRLLNQEEQTYYYVRRQDESNVYRIPLNIDLSTKFEDWIEPDLLQLSSSDVVSVKLNNYQIEERGGGLFSQSMTLVKKPGDQIDLSRKSSTDSWEMNGLDDAKETLLADEVSSIINVLDDMAIVDVAKKPTLDGRPLLDADLNYNLTPDQAKLMSIRTQADLDRLNPQEQMGFENLQIAIAELRQDLQVKGFNFGSTGEKLELVSAGGEVQFATSDGLLYTLHIGKANSSVKSAIKLGGAADGSDETSHQESGTETEGGEEKNGDEAPSEEQEPSTSETDPDKPADDDESLSDETENRYVLIRVSFDESFLGEPLVEPTAPAEPQKPEGYFPAEEAKDDADENGKPTGEQADSDEESDDAPKPEAVERDPSFVAYDDAVERYEEAKIDFEVETSEFKRLEEERASKIKEGKLRAKTLNGRFEHWYYVVGGENLNTLQAERKTLVEEKETPAEDVGAIPNTSFPQIDLPDQPTLENTEEAPKVDVAKPPTQQPETDQPVTETPSSEQSDAEPTSEAEPSGKQSPPEESPASEESPSEQPSPSDDQETSDGEGESEKTE